MMLHLTGLDHEVHVAVVEGELSEIEGEHHARRRARSREMRAKPFSSFTGRVTLATRSLT